jgi:hypothetical protein
VEVDDFDVILFEGGFPVGVGREDGVVVALFVTVVDGRGDEEEPGDSGGMGFRDEALHAAAEGSEAGLVEGLEDSIVHAIAGDDDLRSGAGEDAGQSFEEAGPWEGSAGVAVLAEAREGFRGEAEAEDLEWFFRMELVEET